MTGGERGGEGREGREWIRELGVGRGPRIVMRKREEEAPRGKRKGKKDERRGRREERSSEGGEGKEKRRVVGTYLGDLW